MLLTCKSIPVLIGGGTYSNLFSLNVYVPGLLLLILPWGIYNCGLRQHANMSICDSGTYYVGKTKQEIWHCMLRVTSLSWCTTCVVTSPPLPLLLCFLFALTGQAWEDLYI